MNYEAVYEALKNWFEEHKSSNQKIIDLLKFTFNCEVIFPENFPEFIDHIKQNDFFEHINFSKFVTWATAIEQSILSSQNSIVTLKELIETVTAGSTASCPISTLERFYKSFKKSDKRKMCQQQLSTKKQKVDTPTSTMPVTTEPQPVDVLCLETLNTSSDESSMEDELLDVQMSGTKNTGITGLSTSILKKDKCYTFNSPRIIDGPMYLDVKIYDMNKNLLKLDSMNLWKSATFRSKIVIKSKKTINLVRELKKQLIIESKAYPDVKSKYVLATKKE